MAEVVSCSKVVTMHALDSRQPQHSYALHRGNVNGLSINHNSNLSLIQAKSLPPVDRMAKYSLWPPTILPINSSKITSIPILKKNHPLSVHVLFLPVPNSLQSAQLIVQSRSGI